MRLQVLLAQHVLGQLRDAAHKVVAGGCLRVGSCVGCCCLSLAASEPSAHVHKWPPRLQVVGVAQVQVGVARQQRCGTVGRRWVIGGWRQGGPGWGQGGCSGLYRAVACSSGLLLLLLLGRRRGHAVAR